MLYHETEISLEILRCRLNPFADVFCQRTQIYSSLDRCEISCNVLCNGVNIWGFVTTVASGG